VPEVIADGRTGFVCDDDDALVPAIARVGEIDRGACRRWVEDRFSVTRMAIDYERVYRRLAARHAGDEVRAAPVLAAVTSPR
jgi:glycosyltransferase involved in cell wall biosynthesis